MCHNWFQCNLKCVASSRMQPIYIVPSVLIHSLLLSGAGWSYWQLHCSWRQQCTCCQGYLSHTRKQGDYIHSGVCLCVGVSVCMSMCVHVHMTACVHVCACAHGRMCACVRAHARVCACLPARYLRMYKYMCALPSTCLVARSLSPVSTKMHIEDVVMCSSGTYVRTWSVLSLP